VGAPVVAVRYVAVACVRAAEVGRDRRYVVAGRRHELPVVCAQVARLCGVQTPRAMAPRLALAGSGVIELTDRLRRRPSLVTPRGTRVLLDMNRQWISSARASRTRGYLSGDRRNTERRGVMVRAARPHFNGSSRDCWSITATRKPAKPTTERAERTRSAGKVGSGAVGAMCSRAPRRQLGRTIWRCRRSDVTGPVRW